MMLNIFARDKTYFQSLRDNKMDIDSHDIDSQYDSIVSYLNNEIVSAINDIIDEALPGIVGSPSTYLRNKGDGSTGWDTIEKGIDNHSIAFSKLVQSAVNSVLATDGYGEVVAISTNVADSVLIAQDGDAPLWAKLNSVNISAEQITGGKIASRAIAREHLKPGTLVPNIANGSVRGDNFAVNEITENKFLDESISINKLGVIPINFPIIYNIDRRGQILKEHIVNGTLTPQKFANQSIICTMFNKYRCLTINKVAPETITDKYLINYAPIQSTNAMFNSDILAPDFKLTRAELSLGNGSSFSALTCANFEDVVYSAFLSKGCRDSQINTGP